MSRPQSYTEGSTGEAPGSQQTKSTRRSKVTSERVALLVLCALMAAAVIVIYCLYLDNFQIKTNLQTLRDENEALKRNLTERLSETKPHTTVQPVSSKPPEVKERLSETKPCITVPPVCPTPPEVKINDSCLKCETGWEQHGQCYFFSTGIASWEISRHLCQQVGDLVKIDSREEQKFLEYRLREKMDNPDDKFWIGLTDSTTEGEWLWVDDSPLNTSLRFWRKGEPDDWKGNGTDGEDCVRMGEKEGASDLLCWYDQSCETPHRRICEKRAGLWG